MRREVGPRLSARGLVAAALQRAARESQACAASDARTSVASALSSSASTTQERVGPRGSCRTESNLADGLDENLGRASRGLGVSGVCDRLLHTGDRGLEPVASLSNGRRVGGGRASGVGAVVSRKL